MPEGIHPKSVWQRAHREDLERGSQLIKNWKVIDKLSVTFKAEPVEQGGSNMKLWTGVKGVT